MLDRTVVDMAQEMGFNTAVIATDEIPINSEYLKYCEENRCGNYNANYACPPDCGTPEQMHEKLLKADTALVLQSQWDVPGYGTPEVLEAKANHNSRMHRLRDMLRERGYNVFAVGYGGCTLCEPCKRKENKPCSFPERSISCMSAYCVDAAILAEKCALPFAWDSKKLYLFGMLVFSDTDR